MIEIDARGMRCPWPALRAARALRGGEASVVVVLADDPAAAGELAVMAAAAGWQCEATGKHRFRIERCS